MLGNDSNHWQGDDNVMECVEAQVNQPLLSPRKTGNSIRPIDRDEACGKALYRVPQ